MTLDDVADRIEIDDLLTRYAVAIDTKDWNLLATVFTPDAFIDYTSAGGTKGRFPEVRAWLAETLAGFPMTQHLVANRAVTLEGDTARGRSYFYNPMQVPDGKGGRQLFFVGGYYRDRFARTPEGWRIEETAWVDGAWPAGVERPNPPVAGTPG